MSVCVCVCVRVCLTVHLWKREWYGPRLLLQLVLDLEFIVLHIRHRFSQHFFQTTRQREFQLVRTQRCRLNNRNVAARSAEKSWKNPLKEQESLKMPRGKPLLLNYSTYVRYLPAPMCCLGGRTRGHKGRPKHYLTREEIEAEEQRKKKESEWKVGGVVYILVE